MGALHNMCAFCMALALGGAEYRKRSQRAWEAITGVFHKRRKIGAATNQQESPFYGVNFF